MNPKEAYAVKVLDSVCSDRNITVNVFGKAIISRAICHFLGNSFDRRLFEDVFAAICTEEEKKGNRASIVKLVNSHSTPEKDALMFILNQNLDGTIFSKIIDYPYDENEIKNLFGDVA